MLQPKITLLFAGLVLGAASSGAQTKIAGTLQCAKPDPQNAIPVGDRSGHAFVVMKEKCTWTKPIELAGVSAKTGEDTVFAEASGAKSRDSGYHVTIMANGDQFVVRFSGTTTTDKNGVVQAQTGTWTFVNGTGKLNGLTGKGTYEGKGAADGSVTTQIEGDYQIAGK
jgi:hypothetical protein